MAGRMKARDSRKGIRHTTREPKWKRNLRAAGKGLRRDLWNALAGVGLVAVIVLIIKLIG